MKAVSRVSEVSSLRAERFHCSAITRIAAMSIRYDSGIGKGHPFPEMTRFCCSPASETNFSDKQNNEHKPEQVRTSKSELLLDFRVI